MAAEGLFIHPALHANLLSSESVWRVREERETLSCDWGALFRRVLLGGIAPIER
jgi:hypothetical protein